MNIRAFTPSDLDELKRIHSLYFADQLDLPDFLHYVGAFVIEDENGIISFSGLRNILECVTVTNMSRSPKDRGAAIHKIFDVSAFIARKAGHDQIYVWSQVEKWTKRLKKMGCRDPQGQSLILDL